MRSTLLAGLAGVLLAACATEVKAPTANAGQPVRVPPLTPVSLDGSKSSDPQGLPLSYSWTFRSVPAGSAARFADPHRASVTFTADLAGTYEVELVVDNGMKQSVPATVSVTADASVGVVLPVAGFSVSSVYAGDKDFMTRPHGIAVDGSGVIYVAQAAVPAAAPGAANVPPRVTRHAGGASSILAQSGYLTDGAEGVAWDQGGGRLLVTTGLTRIVALTPAGVQSQFADAPRGSSLFGIAVVPQAGATPSDRIYAGDANTDTVLTFDSTGLAGAALLGGTATAPVPSPTTQGWGIWGVAGMVSAGANVTYGAYGNGSIYRQQSGATTTLTRLAINPLLDVANGIVLTPCPTPKLVVASFARGTLSVLDDCTTNDCATDTQLLTGLANPVGLAFDTSGASPVLYVTDETLRAVFRVDGPFCTL